MFRPRPWHNNQLSTVSFVQDLGTTINYQPYVSSRPWHKYKLSTVCFVQDIGTAINYQPYSLSSKTLAQQSTIYFMFCPEMAQQLSINRMFRPDLGTTINYQPYVSSRPWHNNQLSTVCFVQDLGTTINYQPYVSSKTLVQLSTISRICRRPRPWHNNQLSTFVSSRPWYNNQLSTICFVQTLAPQ